MHSEEAYLDEVKCDLLRLIRKRLYQQALNDGKEIKEYECSFEGVVICREKTNLSVLILAMVLFWEKQIKDI